MIEWMNEWKKEQTHRNATNSAVHLEFYRPPTVWTFDVLCIMLIDNQILSGLVVVTTISWIMYIWAQTRLWPSRPLFPVPAFNGKSGHCLKHIFKDRRKLTKSRYAFKNSRRDTLAAGRLYSTDRCCFKATKWEASSLTLWVWGVSLTACSTPARSPTSTHYVIAWLRSTHLRHLSRANTACGSDKEDAAINRHSCWSKLPSEAKGRCHRIQSEDFSTTDTGPKNVTKCN